MKRLHRRVVPGEKNKFEIPGRPAMSIAMQGFFERPKNDFLRFLFKDCREGFVEIRYIREGENKNLKRTFIPLKDLENAEIQTYDKCETYFGVCTRSNDRSGGKKDILEIPCLWADFDFPPSKFMPYLEKEGVPLPSAMVMTGRGTHIYWVFDKPVGSDQTDQVEDLLKRVAYVTDSDMKSAEIAHCLRVPGTRNFKRSSAVVLLPIEKRWVYSIDELDEKLPKIPQEKKKQLDTRTPFIWQGVLEGERHVSLAQLVGRYLSRRMSDKEIWILVREWNDKNQPPLPDNDLEYHYKDLVKRYRNEDDDLLHTDSFTDTHMAIRLKNLYGENLRFCLEKGIWFCWNEKYWEKDTRHCVITQNYVKEVSLYSSGRVRNITTETERKMEKDIARKLIQKAEATQSQNRRRYILEAARTELPISENKFDQNRWLFNCANGTLNLYIDDFEFREYRRKDMITKISRVMYDPKAKSPEWIKFLRKVTGEDQETIDYLQRIAGYCMTSIADEKQFFDVYGPRHSGKTTYIQTIKELSWDYATSASFASFLAKNDDKIRNDIAGWQGMRMVVATETEADQKLSTALIKVLTGGDSWSDRPLYTEFKDHRGGATFKIILYGNEYPTAPPSDATFYDRCKIVTIRIYHPGK
jgi:hypothetical protein